MVELYRKCRIKIADGRAAPPIEPGYNFNINRWALYAPGSTYFLPVEEMTAIYVNAMLEAFDEQMAPFVVDERASFGPAGISRFAQSKGGHLNNDTSSGRMATIQAIEASLAEACALEQGMVLQNLALLSQRRPYGPHYERVGRAPTAQPHGALGGVHVDVHLARPELEPQQRRRMPLLGQQVSVSLGDRWREGVSLHNPAVNGDVQVAAGRETHGERADETPHHGVLERNQAPREREAVDL